MKKITATAIFIVLCHIGYSQEKNFIDQPYVETIAKADTLISPDRIFISIILNEADSKNRKSTEELEQLLEQKLKELNINITTDLTLLDYNSNFKMYFLKGQNILKSKNYSLLVKDAVTAAKVLTELESVGISNISIERTEYSKAEEIMLELRVRAMSRAHLNAIKLVEPLNQKIGKAIYISDNNSITTGLQGKTPGIIIRGASSLYGSRSSEPLMVDFHKIRFEIQVSAKFIVL